MRIIIQAVGATITEVLQMEGGERGRMSCYFFHIQFEEQHRQKSICNRIRSRQRTRDGLVVTS